MAEEHRATSPLRLSKDERHEGPLFHRYDVNCDSSLLTNYGILRHVKSQNPEADPVPIAQEGRNFALNVAQCLSVHFEQFKVDWSEFAATGPRQESVREPDFMRLLKHYIGHALRGSKDVPMLSDIVVKQQGSMSPLKFLTMRLKRTNQHVPHMTKEEEELAAIHSPKKRRKRRTTREQTQLLIPGGGSRPAPVNSRRLTSIRMEDSVTSEDLEHDNEDQRISFLPQEIEGVQQEFVDLFRNHALFDDCSSRLFRALDVADSACVTWETLSDYLAEAAAKGPVRPMAETINLYQRTKPMPRAGHPVHSVQDLGLWQPGRIGVHSEAPWTTHGQLESVVEVYDSGQWKTPVQRVWCQSTVVGFEYLPGQGLLVSSADLQLRVYDVRAERAPPAVDFCAEDTFTMMKWCSRWQRLFAAGTTGSISTWTVPASLLRGGKLKKVAGDRLHQSTVTSLFFLPYDGSIVSASMDPQLLIQEPSRGEVVASFSGHRSAITSACYNEDYHFLASCGFDAEVYIWSLHTAGNGDGCKPILLHDKEEPHHQPVVGVESIQHTPQLLTLDHSGLFKVWDIRTFRCVQNIHLAGRRSHHVNRETDYHGFKYVPSQRGCLCYTHRHLQFAEYTDKHSEYDPSRADEVIVGLVHSVSSGTVVTATQSSLQTWEIQSGVKSGEYRIADGEIEVTALTIDHAGRRVLAGYRNGSVAYFSAVNGQKFKSIQCSHHDIIDVCCHNLHGVSFAVDATGNVFVFSDRNDSVPLTLLEEKRHARFVRVSDASRCLLVFHSGYEVSVFVLRTVKGDLPVFFGRFTVASELPNSQGRMLSTPRTPSVRDSSPATPKSPKLRQLKAAVSTISIGVAQVLRAKQRQEAQDEKQLNEFVTDDASANVNEDVPDGEVSCACILGDFPLVACVDSTGHLSVWGLPSHSRQLACIARWEIIAQWEISTLEFSKQHSVLFTGDACGAIAAYDFAFVHSNFERGPLDIRLVGEYRISSANFALDTKALLRVASILLIESLSIIIINTSDRHVYVLSFALGKVTPYGLLSLDRSSYRLPSGLDDVEKAFLKMIATAKSSMKFVYRGMETASSCQQEEVFHQTQLKDTGPLGSLKSPAASDISTPLSSYALPNPRPASVVELRLSPSAEIARQSERRIASVVDTFRPTSRASSILRKGDLSQDLKGIVLSLPSLEGVPTVAETPQVDEERPFGRHARPMSTTHHVPIGEPITEAQYPEPLGKPTPKLLERPPSAEARVNSKFNPPKKRAELSKRELREQTRKKNEHMWKTIREKSNQSDMLVSAPLMTDTVEVRHDYYKLYEELLRSEQRKEEERQRRVAEELARAVEKPLGTLDPSSVKELVSQRSYGGAVERLQARRKALSSRDTAVDASHEVQISSLTTTGWISPTPDHSTSSSTEQLQRGFPALPKPSRTMTPHRFTRQKSTDINEVKQFKATSRRPLPFPGIFLEPRPMLGKGRSSM